MTSPRVAHLLPLLLSSALASACLGDAESLDSPDTPTNPGGKADDADGQVPDPNVRLVSARASGSSVAADEIATYAGWNKQYYRVLPGRNPDEVAFYHREQSYVRIMRLNASGGYSTVSTSDVVGRFDEVLRGNFAGTSEPDLLFYSRSSRLVLIYEMRADGLYYVFGNTLPKSPRGGTWDVITSGYLGGSYDDLLLYNKTEGAAKIMRWASSGYAPVKEYWGWKKTWDQIVPGRFDGDAYTDFLFYNQDGSTAGAGAPTNGQAKVISFGNTFNLAVLSDMSTSWPMSPNAILVPGQFGGDDRTDVLVYDGAATSAAGQSTLWVNDGSGRLSARAIWTEAKRWTHIVPMQVNGGLSDLLYFTTQRRIKIVPVLINNASPASIPADFASSITAANEAFAPAGIYFSLLWTNWSLYVPELEPTDQNPCMGSADQAWLNDMAAYIQSVYGNDTLVVYVREKGGMGCSDPTKSFVIMPQWANNLALLLDRATALPPTNMVSNPKLLVHELGHHFSLPHSQPDTDFVYGPANPYAHDTDARSSVGFTPVFDTPPNPNAGGMLSEWFVDLTATTPARSWCDDNAELTIQPQGATPYQLNPERHNIMSRSINCDGMYRLSPGQIRAIRDNLWNAQEYTDAPDTVAGGFDLPRMIDDSNFGFADIDGNGSVELVVFEDDE